MNSKQLTNHEICPLAVRGDFILHPGTCGLLVPYNINNLSTVIRSSSCVISNRRLMENMSQIARKQDTELKAA